ncbi:hypothetical protein [Collinsella tanakaei]|uniref:hypothetical protein n=1 Tax=Collinsella tanakaei TaxID=626935 RepID=UPI0025A4245D|nr:hypothetical protein [Collinsella tanakaei]MDM8300739.1 hypothetical protein [Collinsella tanakaei]
MMRRMLLSLACALVLCLGLPTTALAARSVPYIDGDGNSKTIFEATEITSEHTQLTRGWYVVYGDVTISERIEVTGDDPTTCYVSLILADGCTLTASKGIGVEEGASLFIYGQSEDEGTMGKLYASSSSSDAAIGGDINFSSDTNGPITINGGRIEARSFGSGSAIGGGWNAPGGPVAINGGIVNALATGGGAAIGGGRDANGYSKGGTVEIAGGSVTAISAAGAAIGGGSGNSDHGTLTIAPKSGRLVSASTGDGAESAVALAGSPFMSGTSVQVPIDEMGRKYFSCSTTKLLTVSHLDENGVERTRTDCLPVVAGDEQWKDGWYAVDSNVSVERRIVVDGDVNLILTDGNALNVKGGIEVTKGNSLTIYAQSTDEATMGSLTATTRNSGFADCAAIGGGATEDTADAGTITIHGGAVTADNAGGYSRAAGIGGGYWYPDAGKGGTVTITGGVVTAFGGWNAAGIGGGQLSDGGSLTVAGGVVSATGGKSFGAAIGGGLGGDGGTVLVEGGVVTATTVYVSDSVSDAAAIGGGGNIGDRAAGNGADVTITGGTVIAQTYKGVSAVGAGRSLASTGKTDPGTLKIAPAQDQAIAGIAGADEKSAAPVDGSPFTAEQQIVDLVQSASYFRCASGGIDDVTRISVQPKGATVDEGDSATFEVSASGTGTLSYQWQQRSGTEGEWTNIEGANDVSYTTPATTADMDGMQFRCLVTGGLGMAASDPATLTVIAKPVFEISLDPADVDFGKLVEGSLQGQVQPVTVTITNTGNQPLEIRISQSEAFELVLEASSGQLDPGDAVEVSIVPKDGLDAGTYSESVVISGVNGQNTATAALELSASVVHDLVKVEAKSATCTDDGNDEYWACEACDKVFGDADGNEEIKLGDVAIPATGHDPADGWEGDAGGHWRSCLNGCGERLEYAGHEPEVVGAKEPTCTEDGYSGDAVCSVCGFVLAEGEAVPATGHDWGEDGRCKLCGAMRSSSTSTDNADDDRESLAKTGDGSVSVVAALCALAAAAVATGTFAMMRSRRS